MASSRRDLLNDMAEQRPISKNSQYTHRPRFGFTPETGIPQKRGLIFTVSWLTIFNLVAKKKSQIENDLSCTLPLKKV